MPGGGHREQPQVRNNFGSLFTEQRERVDFMSVLNFMLELFFGHGNQAGANALLRISLDSQIKLQGQLVQVQQRSGPGLFLLALPGLLHGFDQPDRKR